MPDRSTSTSLSAAGMVLGALVSIQIGAAVAVGLFSEIGTGGVVFLRALTGAVVLILVWRPGQGVGLTQVLAILLVVAASAGALNANRVPAQVEP